MRNPSFGMLQAEINAQLQSFSAVQCTPGLEELIAL